ncbi:MAG TPA: hypothetical protein VGO37_19920 [Steroidobacteraceae bacterium]|jgi:hypothetical protein|nr:hypothetical protein [Steroidobacteraceae bacterium]
MGGNHQKQREYDQDAGGAAPDWADQVAEEISVLVIQLNVCGAYGLKLEPPA